MGPFKKSSDNPILSSINSSRKHEILSTGHGSIVATRFTGTDELSSEGSHRESTPDAQSVTHFTPQGSELFYVHHGRNSTTNDRALYTTRLTLRPDDQASMGMRLTAVDQPWPAHTEPVSIEVSSSRARSEQGKRGPYEEHARHEPVTAECSGSNITFRRLSVRAADRSTFLLDEASNRVVLRRGTDGTECMPASLRRTTRSSSLHDIYTASFRASERVVASRHSSPHSTHLVYQRQSARGSWNDVVSREARCR